MAKKFITIQEAAEMSGKSVQTIRRAVKGSKVEHRRIKTPQGFNYMINRKSLCLTYNLPYEESAEETAEMNETTPNKVETAKKDVVSKENVEEETMALPAKEFREFTRNLERMLNQHSDERQNFLRLINTLQEKIFVLENQLNLLKAPEKSWYQFWK